MRHSIFFPNPPPLRWMSGFLPPFHLIFLSEPFEKKTFPTRLIFVVSFENRFLLTSYLLRMLILGKVGGSE